MKYEYRVKSDRGIATFAKSRRADAEQTLAQYNRDGAGLQGVEEHFWLERREVGKWERVK